MISWHEWEGEGTRLDAAQVDGDEPEARRTDRADDLAAHGLDDRPDQVVLGQFDPGDFAVVANPQFGET
jgi:hypothetical protein